MKKYLLTALLISASIVSQANTIEKDLVTAEPATGRLQILAIQNPKFPRGEEALKQFLTSLIADDEQKFAGQKAKLAFSIDAMGLIYNIQIIECDSELLKEKLKGYFTQMPHWEPATLDGLPINSRVVLPITIQE
jgi:hypothetical protein